MELNTGVLAIQILNVALLLAWIGLAILALFRLRKEELADTAQVIWTVIILLIPIFGALAFFIVRSGKRS